MNTPLENHEQGRLAEQARLPQPHDLSTPPEGDPLKTEWKAFQREIGRLLEAGLLGRFAVVQGDTVHGVWPSLSDALQAGRLRFKETQFLVQEIQPLVRPLRYGYSRLCNP